MEIKTTKIDYNPRSQYVKNTGSGSVTSTSSTSNNNEVLEYVNKMFTFDVENQAIKANYNFFGVGEISAYGLGSTTGGTGGISYDRLDLWGDYDTSKSGYVLSAGLGNDLNSRLIAVEVNGSTSISTSGTGNAVTSVSKSGSTLVFNKGITFADATHVHTFASLTSKPTTLSGYGITDASLSSHVHTFSSITSKPTTLSGYGIVDNINNLSNSLYTDRLTEPNFKTGDITNTARPIFDVLRGDRTAFLPAEQIIVEISTDAGVTWTDAGIPDTTKRKLFTGQRPSLNIPLKNGVKSTDCMMRITVTGMKYNVPSGTTETEKYGFWNSTYVQSTERYFSASEAWMWVNSNSDRIYLKIEKATGANSESWVTDREAYLSGWSGGSYASMGGGVFGGGTTQTGNYWNYRFTFRTCTNSNTFNDGQLSTTYTTSSQSISHIKVSGKNVWVSSNYYMYKEHMYTWDEYKNVIFPANVTAPTFTGVASSATKLANSRSIWGNSFDGTGDVTGVLSITATTTNSAVFGGSVQGAIAIQKNGTLGIGLYSPASGVLGVYDYNASLDRLYIHSSGNIGIGTTTDASFKLDITGTLRTTGAITADRMNTTSESHMSVGAYTDPASGVGAGLKVNGNFAAGGNSYFSGGNVLINTLTDSGYKLDINGNTRVTGSLHLNNEGWLNLYNGANTSRISLSHNADVAKLDIYNRSTSAWATIQCGNIEAQTISIYNDQIERFIRSNVFGGAIRLRGNSAAATDRGIRFGRVDNSLNWLSQMAINADTGNVMINTTTDGGYKLDVNGNTRVTGNLLATGEVTAYSASDKRLKTDIQQLTNSLDIINKLNPVSYRWNSLAKELNSNKNDGEDYGLIAQELVDVLPNLVHNVYNTYKSIDYIKLVPFLIAGMKEQSLKIERLERRIEELSK